MFRFIFYANPNLSHQIYLPNFTMMFFMISPIKTPGMTNTIGKKIGPNNTPKISNFVEYITPTVTK